MKVLSLFDGMACGILALIKAEIEIESYDAFENNKYATKTATHNFPIIRQHGDVFNADFTQFKGVDLLCGGSPCTYWSIAQKNNRETEASGMGWELFQQYVRAVKEAEPKYFIYENNKSMSKAIRESIDKAFGFEAVLINSALVSAQNRQRLYWVGKRNEDGTYSKVDIEQPEDRGILLKDILDSSETWRTKSVCLDAHYYKGGNFSNLDKQSGQRFMVAEPIRIPEYGNEDKGRPLGANYPNNCGGFEHRMFSDNPNKQQVDMVAEPVNVTTDDKAHCLKAGYYKQGMANFVTNGGHIASCVAEPVNVTEDGKSQTIKAQYQQTSPKNICCYTSTYGASGVAEPIRVGCLPSPDGEIKNSQAMRVYSVDGKAVNQTAQGGGLGAKTGLYAIQCCPMKVKEATKRGYLEVEPGEAVDMTQPNSKTRRGRNMSLKSNCVMTSCQYYQYCGVLGYATVCEWDDLGNPIKAISCADGKIYQVYEVENGQITIKGKQYPIKLVDGFYIIRKLTVRECMRLQTVPEWYEFPVSNSQAYKMLGNGWTVDVIAHIFKYLK